jgi:hypothetical protein
MATSAVHPPDCRPFPCRRCLIPANPTCPIGIRVGSAYGIDVMFRFSPLRCCDVFHTSVSDLSCPFQFPPRDEILGS